MRPVKSPTVILTFIAVFLLTGCGGDGQQQPAEPTQTKPQPSATGSLVATVSFKGDEPDPETYDASGNPECGVNTIKGKKVVVNDNGTLKNVVVAVQSGPGGLSQPSEKVLVDQNQCMYHPHVVTAKAGQTIKITDSDQGLHNVRATHKPTGQQIFNLTTFKGQTKEVTINKTGVVGLQCDVHPWMQGWIYVTQHGAAGVTGADGTARLADLPTGEYTLEFWHEKYGTKTKTVTIEKNQEARIKVTFNA